MSQLQNTQSFSNFWKEIWHPLLKLFIRVAWQFPIAILVAGFLARLLQCYTSLDNIQEQACADLSSPLGMIKRWWDVVPYIYVLMPIPFLALLYLEWSKYRKDEPSYFTHDTFWCQSQPWMLEWKKELFRDVRKIGQGMVEAENVGANFARIRGGFCESDVRTYAQRFAGWWNKPNHKNDHHMDWDIRIRNGDEIHIHLDRSEEKPGMWVMRTEFYEWTGRKNSPRLAQTHVTEFVTTISQMSAE